MQQMFLLFRAAAGSSLFGSHLYIRKQMQQMRRYKRLSAGSQLLGSHLYIRKKV